MNPIGKNPGETNQISTISAANVNSNKPEPQQLATNIQQISQQIIENSPTQPDQTLALTGRLTNQSPNTPITAVDTTAISKSFDEKLEDWVSKGVDTSEREKRLLASGLIKKAYNDKSADLYLLDLNLYDLPDAISDLTSLKKLVISENLFTSIPLPICSLSSLEMLFIDKNRIKKIPENFKNLTSLKELHMNENKLTELPNVLCELSALQRLLVSCNHIVNISDKLGLLVNLTEIDLSDNQIITLPASFQNLVNLEGTLDLSSNSLESLPLGMGAFTKVNEIILNENPNLFALPLDLVQNQTLDDIVIEDTQINEALRKAILILCKNPMVINLTGRITLKAALKAVIQKWEVIGGFKNKLTDKCNSLSKEQESILFSWFVRLECTEQFKNNQSSLASVVCNLLITALTDSVFKEFFFAQAEENNLHCRDRSAMALNELHTAWIIHNIPADNTIEKKLEILTGAAKATALRNVLGKMIDAFETLNKGKEQTENVEIYLYYENALRDKLKLVSSIKIMPHGDTGKKEWLNLDTLESFVNKNMFDTLYKIPAFEKLLLTDPNVETQFKSLSDELKKNLDSLGDCPKGDEDSQSVLDYKVKIGEIKFAFEKSKKSIAENWYVNPNIRMTKEPSTSQSGPQKRQHADTNDNGQPSTRNPNKQSKMDDEIDGIDMSEFGFD